MRSRAPTPLFTLLASLAVVGCGGTGDARPTDDDSPTPGEAPAEVATAADAATATALPAASEAGTVTVWKTPTCGCCGNWVEHLQAAGFDVDTRDVSQMELMSVKEEHGVGAEHASCHTALVDGYVVEGHVPAETMARMLEERPDIRGLAVPGMPVGSPGMEVGDQQEPYDVLALTQDGSAVVYESR